MVPVSLIAELRSELLNQGDRDKAQRHFQRALSLLPQNDAAADARVSGSRDGAGVSGPRERLLAKLSDTLGNSQPASEINAPPYTAGVSLSVIAHLHMGHMWVNGQK